jgi:uncharacterized cofD-like protein
MNKNVVVMGGGSGTYNVLTALKDSPNLNLSAVVSIADSGGSSGQLRDEFGILPPGDIRRAILALSDPPIDYSSLRQLFSYRFGNGTGLNGHSFGNLMLTALKEILGTEIEAIEAISKMFRLKGKVLPVSLDKTNLCARLEDGTIIKGETNIDIRTVRPDLKILDVFIDPMVEIFKQAEETILKADWIIIGPGDLYTSLIPNLLISGTNKAINNSKAKIIYICNLMTKYGETDGFCAQDFVLEVDNYLQEAENKLEYVIVNSENKVPKKLKDKYIEEKAYPVLEDKKRKYPKQVKIIKSSVAQAGQLWRHDPEKLKEEILKIIF